MKDNFKHINILKLMFSKYLKVTYVGIGAAAFSMICILFKCNPHLNVPLEWMRMLGEFLLNISISIIAAEIFFIFQVVIPEGKRDYLMRVLMYNTIAEIAAIPLSNMKLQLLLYDQLTEWSSSNDLSEIPDEIKRKPIEDEEIIIKKNMQNIKENIDFNIKMFIEYIPDDILALLEIIEYSPLMDNVTLYNDFSDIKEDFEEIEPLIDELNDLIRNSDMAYRTAILSVRSSGEIVRNNITIIKKTQELYDDTKSKQ